MSQYGLTNWYSKVPDHLKKKVHNPHYNKHLIDLPFRMIICGPSGSAKTQTALEIIHKMKSTFEKIIICVKNKNEPLYQMLAEKIKDGLEFYEGGEIASLPEEADGQTLIIFDDLVLEKNQSPIEQFYIRGRKLDYSCMYLTQSYFKTPKLIRINCDYIIIKKLSGKKDLKLVLSEYNLGLPIELLIEIYEQCTQNKLSFLMISINSDESEKFRCAFTPMTLFKDD